MKTRKPVLSLMLSFVFFLAACGGTAPEAMEKPAEETMMDNPTEEAMPHETAMPDAMEKPTDEAMMDEPTEEAMMETPAWFGVSFNDVRGGEVFTINDFKGKVVLVETMAVWCSTCYEQQTQLKALYESLGMRDDLVIVSLDIDPNEDESVLAGYTRKNSEFEWRYAVAGPEVAREMGNTYGDQFLNPPSAPVLIIDRHGVAHPLPFGLKSAEDLMKTIQPYLDETM
jgi:cytochrome oxidase Cu insertion factor (SCO1/SenC/PrrC family)